MTTICGHERSELQRALEFANSSNLDAILRDWSRPNDATGALLHDVHDPAKLASIIAELLRERGHEIETNPIRFEEVMHKDAVRVWTVNDTIRVEAKTRGSVYDYVMQSLSMPQARAFALRLLDSPETDIERMIEEVMR